MFAFIFENPIFAFNVLHRIILETRLYRRESFQIHSYLSAFVELYKAHIISYCSELKPYV